MNSAQLYTELLQSGERVFRALADERDIDIFGPGDSNDRNWEEHLSSARRSVERAAESYAAALRTYRVALLSELGHSAPARPSRSLAKQRKKMRAAASCRRIDSRKPPKSSTVERPIASRLAKIQ